MWLAVLTLTACLSHAWGHGRVIKPPSRASAWRAGFDTEPDYDDDGSNCGGFSRQWTKNGGKCGVCGDAYDLPKPRPHELGGKYGTGVIVGHYKSGEDMDVTVQLTTSHHGYWQLKLCPDAKDDQTCFDQHVLELIDGGTIYYPLKGSEDYNLKYKLPPGVKCEHCVLQWHYVTGNSWGVCKNGTEGLGCGNQEEFGACSDISID